ncbi:MAG: sugar dehydrogenase complex small subunit [Blastocatellia bacterium]
MKQPTEADLFLSLSEVLTGEDELDEKLSLEYLKRLKDQYPAQMFDLLKVFGEIADDEYLAFEVRRRILDDAKLLPMAQQVINIWYTAEFVGADGNPKAGTQKQFYSGLLWKIIQAHPPSHSTQPYGYWTTAPEAE